MEGVVRELAEVVHDCAQTSGEDLMRVAVQESQAIVERTWTDLRGAENAENARATELRTIALEQNRRLEKFERRRRAQEAEVCKGRAGWRAKVQAAKGQSRITNLPARPRSLVG